MALAQHEPRGFDMIAVLLRRAWLSFKACPPAFLIVASSLGFVLPAAGETPPSASEILQEMRAFRECGSVLYVAAHPDDENTQFISYLAKERGMRIGYLSLTRGEGGQNLIGPELGDSLGVIRTQELLAARRIDGGQQFFTRARDFGFSKSYEQTLAKWDRQAVLSDVVRVIREFQPDVVVTRFPPEPGGTHGHHTAATMLALEAFKLSGDPKSFPEQLGRDGSLTPWQPKRIFWNAFRGGSSARPTLRLDIGGFLPLLGMSVGEVAALSRSSHRSQGLGSIASRGSRLDEFQPLDGLPAGKDLFDGIDTGWERYRGWEGLAPMATDLIAQFKPADPAASVPALLAIHDRFNACLLPGPLLKKSLLIDRILQHCLGLYVDTTIPQSEVIPGEALKVRHLAILRADVPVRLKTIYFPDLGGSDLSVELRPNQPLVQDAMQTLPVDVPLTQPYWLREEGTSGMYRVDDPTLIGQPVNPPAYPVTYGFDVAGRGLLIETEPAEVTADPVKGEIRRQLTVIPPVSLAMGREVQLFSAGSTGQVEVEIKSYRNNQAGVLKIDAPAGWRVSPESQAFRFATSGEHARFAFTVIAPPQPQTAFLSAHATIEGKTYGNSRREIRYEHFPTQLLQPLARCKAVCLDLAIRGKRVGYLAGAGDRTEEALAAMGYEVTPLGGADLTPDRLKDFDAVVIGVRAFNVRSDLAPGLPALFAYVENGGNVIEQYNTPGELNPPRLAPFDLKLSRDLPRNRVTDEAAHVTILAPDHPALITPNRITAADFDGWVQERGLNFPSEWDHEHFTALLACSDPGEAPLPGGLLVAHYGKGYFVYTGLSFFRQLPAGVPGAYRLFANLVSLGK